MVLRDRLRIIVAVYVVRAPLGPQTWHYLQYATGLKRLGHDVTVVEVGEDEDWTCYDPRTGRSTPDASFGLSYATEVFDRAGLGDDWAYYDFHGRGWTGPAARRMIRTYSTADVFINVSGLSPAYPWFGNIAKRIYVDTDPGFVQVRNLVKPALRRICEEHNVFLTFGERLGAPDCRIPADGFAWRPTRQPVVLGAWRPTPPPADAAFTTVMKWDSYRTRAVGDLHLGMKSESFVPFMDLPLRSPAPLEMLVGGPHPQQELIAAGWRLGNPQVVTPDPWSFQEYINRSAGEFTVAKHGYVVTRSGWFSERSAHYLASGKPVITQETGFSDVLPTGEGLLAFSDLDEALAALQEVVSDPARHAKAAREIAEEHFDSDVVLSRLLDDAGAT